MSKKGKKATATRRDVFAKAIEIIAKRGWMQGALTGPHGSVCALGAVHAAAKALGVKQFTYGYENAPLVYFNDTEGRSKYDVYLKLATLAGK